jgi:hypothetical protein
VFGAVLTLASAAMVLYEKSSKDQGRALRWGLTTEIVVICAAFICLCGTIGAISFGNIVSHLKDVDLAKYKKSADLQIAEANKAANIANQKAEEARLKAEGASKENATLQIKVAKGQAENKEAEAALAAQNEKTIQFTHALQLQQENMAQQMHVSPTLNEQQIRDLSNSLKPFAGQTVILHTTLDTTVLRLSNGIQKALSMASIKCNATMNAGALYQGVTIAVHSASPSPHPPLADALFVGLKQAGIVAVGAAISEVPQENVALYVGPY